MPTAARVLVTEPLAERGLEAMRAAGLAVDVRTGLSPEELRDAIKDAHALVIRSATQVTAERSENLHEYIVGHRSRRANALQRHDDSLSLERTDADRQHAFTIALLQEQQR